MPKIGKWVCPGLRITGNGVVKWSDNTATSNNLIEFYQTGESYPRFALRADGRLMLGGGSGVYDCSISRVSANLMKVTAAWKIIGYDLQVHRNNGTDEAINLDTVSDTEKRLIVDINGKHTWGSGSVAGDCTLERRAANILNTPDRLEVGTLGVANSAGGTVPGNCQNKIEVFDAAGSSLGFIAVYDAIA